MGAAPKNYQKGMKAKAMIRDPYDGEPYYCAICGLGLAELLACEEPECCLESEETAQARKLRRRPMETAQVKPQE